MSIRTADCVKAIVEFFKDKPFDKDIVCNEKNWRRVSKRGNRVNGYIREFRNKKDMLIRVFVKSTDEKILNIHHSIKSLKFAFINNGPDVLRKSSAKESSGFIEHCKKILMKLDNVSSHNFIFALSFESLPMIEDADGFEDGFSNGTEEVDFENSAIISLNDSGIKLWAGGDWQNPVTFSASFKDGKLHYNNDAVESSEDDDSEITTEQLVRIVFGNSHPSELAGKEIADY